MSTAMENSQGIMSLNATWSLDTVLRKLGNERFPYVLSVHPALCIYRKEEGRQMLSESISVFKAVLNEIDKKELPISIDFLEDEELWKI